MFNEYYLWVAGVVLLNLVLAIAAISALRYVRGVSAGVNTTHELSKKDNFAFGISFAGSALALSMIMAAAIGGDPADSFVKEAINITVYAVVGIVLLKIGMMINDAIIFNRFSLKESIFNENVAAGVVHAANFLAVGIVIQSAIRWVETETWEGLISVVLVFVGAQLLLFLVTRLRAQIYMRRHAGKRLQDALQDGNLALAIRYTGHIVAVALGVSATASLISYLPATPWISAAAWFAIALVLAILISCLAAVARMIILKGIDVVDEVDRQRNVGVAFIEAVIFIAIAIILNPIIAMLDSIL